MPKRSAENGATIGYENELWKAADALCGSMDAAMNLAIRYINAQIAQGTC